MNRETLFRGKRLDNDEWVEGVYFPPAHTIITFVNSGTEESPNYEDYIVRPETVGEFTGMTDKNGTAIFEGDIVRTQPFYTRPCSATRKGKQFLGVVNLHNRTFRGNKTIPEQKYDSFWQVDITEDTEKYNHYSWSQFWNCEVVGNKFDNTELLPK